MFAQIMRSVVSNIFVCITFSSCMSCVYAQVTLETMMDTTLNAWSVVDTIRAIAREDRHHLYPRLIKANLDLYANTYWLTKLYKKDTLEPEYVDTIEQLFGALGKAQKETLSGQSISDNPNATLVSWAPAGEIPLAQKNIGGLFSCLIMEQTSHLWEGFTNPTKS